MTKYNKKVQKIKKVVNKEDKATNKKTKADSKKKKTPAKGFYYSLLTIALILCLVQIAISAILNVSKVISYKAKIIQITETRDAALALNEQLKDSINNFSNVAGLEAIARNNLKMSSEDEVLVIINNPKEETEKKETSKPKKLGFIKHD